MPPLKYFRNVGLEYPSPSNQASYEDIFTDYCCQYWLVCTIGCIKWYFLIKEVWGKVIFSEASVCPIWDGSLYDVTSYLASGPMFLLRGSLSLVPCSYQGGLGGCMSPLDRKSGRYTSNWNAFLLIITFME